MADVPANIDIRSQSPRNLRISQIRDLNILDGVVVLSDDYSAADMVAQATASWSEGLNVKGYNAVQFLVDHTVGGALPGDQTSFAIEIQCSIQQNSGSADALWYSRYTSFNTRWGDATALADTSSMTLNTSADAVGTVYRTVIEIEALGHFMRFRPYVVGTNFAGSRCVIRSIRRQT